MKCSRLGRVSGLRLAGCMVGPDYKGPPAAPMTVAYKEAPPASYKSTAVWNVAQPSDGKLRDKWWEMYGDPRLNALEQQVTVANQTLKIAEARFRQARQIVLVNRAAEYPTL